MDQGHIDFSVDAIFEGVAIHVSSVHRSVRVVNTSVAHLRITGAASSASAQLNAEPSILVPD